MDNVLIDTDVILDFFFDRKPFSEYATRVIGLSEAGKIAGFVSPVICSNLFYILRQTASHKKVIDSLKQLLSFTGVLAMDKDVVSHALHSGFRDFKDGLQYFSAIKYGNIDVILTRNLKDYKKSEIGVLTPELYIKNTFANPD